jgi:hypothetical protein
MRTEGIVHLKISKDPTGNRTRNLPSCGAVAQSTAALVSVGIYIYIYIYIYIHVCLCVCVCVKELQCKSLFPTRQKYYAYNSRVSIVGSTSGKAQPMYGVGY